MGYGESSPVVPTGVLVPIRESPLETLKSALWREAQNYPLFHLLQVENSQPKYHPELNSIEIFRMPPPTSLSASRRFVTEDIGLLEKY